MQRTFMIVPTFIKSTTRNPEDSKTMALGGVDTGSMNEKEQDKAAGSINNIGLTCELMPKSFMIGKTMSIYDNSKFVSKLQSFCLY